jgi:hypothetical protein
MRLRELEAEFRHSPDGQVSRPVPTLADANCIWFLCPKCFAKNKGSVGTHWICCWFRGRGVGDDWLPKPGRWTPSGTGLDDLTFVPPPDSTSVLLTSGCGAHFHIRNGEIVRI